MKISVIIPCVDKHLNLLEKLLESMILYTRKPDEVIVSVSPKYLKLNLNDIKKKLEDKYTFLKCIVQKSVTTAGMNRNSCLDIVSGDIIVANDADDIMHPQKLEIIEDIFMKYPDMKLIVHNLINTKKTDYSLKSFQKVDLNQLKFYTDLISGEKIGLKSNLFEKETGLVFGHNYACCTPTVTYDVAKSIQYDNISYGEDAKYVADVNRYYNKTIYLPCKLMIYTQSGSY